MGEGEGLLSRLGLDREMRYRVHEGCFCSYPGWCGNPLLDDGRCSLGLAVEVGSRERAPQGGGGRGRRAPQSTCSRGGAAGHRVLSSGPVDCRGPGSHVK